jgi:glycosyltransferase involved in cell wall biosynthesis
MSKRGLRKIVFTWLSTGQGGGEESTRLISSTIAETYDVEVSLIAWDYEGRGLLRAPESLRVRYVECSTAEDYCRLLRLSLADRPHETVLFGTQRTFHLDTLYAREHGVKCAIILRGLVLPEEAIKIVLPPPAPELKAVPCSQINWQAFERVDALVGISEASADSIRRVVADARKVRWIYNCVPDGWLDEGPPAREFGEPRRFLVASRLVRWKALPVAIEAFAGLAAEFPSVRLDIVGDGPDAESLRRRAAASGANGRIRFHGWQPSAREWYAASDCLIHPAANEGFGRVVAEAQAHGLPVVGARAGALKELITDGRDGFTFAAHDAHACLQALRRLMSLTPGERRAMSAEAARRARRSFHPRRIAQDYVLLAEQLIRG